jgi:O-methyltransferase involved in polyketide biosynthesis
MVLVHARALLADTTPQGETNYVPADYHDPEKILSAAAETIDFSKPTAVMFMGVMGYEPDLEVIRSITRRMMDATAPGSHMVFWDGTNTTPEVVAGADKLAEMGGVPYILRSPAELATVFEGLTLVEPGLTEITAWRPDGEVEHIDAYGAVGRK